ncbi:NADPH-dependent FMN reductase [Colwellia sp. MEBiC06753]
MKVLAFAATNHNNSINKMLANYAASLVPNAEFEMLDINDYEMPIYSQAREEALGHPQLAKDFFAKIGEADAIIISFAEHNGTYTAAYKNLFDWASRIDKKVFQSKPVVYLATSPGPSGAQSVLSTAVNSAPFFDANVKASLSIPQFFDNFDVESQKLTNAEMNQQLQAAVNQLAA